MRKYLSILLLVSALSLGSSMVVAQWKAEYSPTKVNLNAITVTNKGSVWICGDSGTLLYKTKNAWLGYATPTSENIYSIDFINEHDGWAVGSKGIILHYNGTKWENYESPTGNDLFSVNFRDEDNGIAVGKTGTILVYKNGVWSSVKNKQRGNFNTSSYASNDIWLGGGQECVNFPLIQIQNAQRSDFILRDDYASYATINGMYFLNSTNGWAVGSPSTLLHYDGNTWEKQFLKENFASLNFIYFSAENLGISVGYNGTILCFANDRWAKEASGVNLNLKGAAIYDNICYAVGDSGTIVSKIIDPAADFPTTNEIISPQTHAVTIINTNHQFNDFGNEALKIELFPNPSNDRLNIKLVSTDNLVNGSLTVSDIYGKVFLQRKINFSDREFQYILETYKYKGGLYILKIISGEKSITRVFTVNH
jgi:photosystem II stability/assembly factor-like uncharacterized protein